MIGWLLGAAITYSTLKGACNYAGQKGQKAYPGLNRNDFDQSNMIKGFGEFNEEKIKQIAARCGVRPNEYGVLPLFGYENCLDYVKEYHGDLDKFVQAWMLVVKCQEDVQKGRIHSKYNERYHKLENAYQNSKFSDTETTTFTLKHWYDLPIYEHEARCDEIYDDTFLGDYAIGRPVVHASTKVYGARSEVWTVKKEIHDLPHSDNLTDRIWKGAYNTCCKYLGYQP